MSGPLPVTASRMGCLLDALTRARGVLGLGVAAGGDEVFRDLVLARIIEPASELDGLRVLEEAGVAVPSYRIVLWRLPAYAKDAFRPQLAGGMRSARRTGPGQPGPLLRAALHRAGEDDAWSPGDPGRKYGLRDFADAEAELAERVAAWEGPKAIFLDA